MKRNNFLLLATVVAAAFGLAFLIAPAQLVALYGVKLTPATEVLGRIAGSTRIPSGGARASHTATRRVRCRAPMV